MNPTTINQLHQLLAKQDQANNFMEQVDQELIQFMELNDGIDFDSILADYQAIRDAN